MENKDYTKILESYLIPSEEGFLSWFKNKIRSNKNSNKSDNNNRKSDAKTKYQEYINAIISKINEESPEEIEKEFNARKIALKQMISSIKRVEAKYHSNPNLTGFEFNYNNITALANGDYEYIDKNYLDADFIEKVLSPNKPDEYSSKFYIDIIDCDIFEWGEKNPNFNMDEMSLRDYDDTKEYHDTMNSIFKDLETALKSNPVFEKVDYYGDWDDGPIVICLKPTDRFLAIAKKYGYKY